MSEFLSWLATFIWTPVLFLIILGGLFFLLYSRFIQYKYFKHAIDVLRGKYYDPKDAGQIEPYEALSTNLASTVGMGNIAGVAVAISIGGPGALFWMWVTAFVGMSSNFFTSTLSVMYRGKDSAGEIQGGPMYVLSENKYVIRDYIRKKLNESKDNFYWRFVKYPWLVVFNQFWYFFPILFSVCCMVGCLPIFQANQLTQVIIDIGFQTSSIKASTFGFLGTQVSTLKFIIGTVLMLISGIVVVGGINRIGSWAGKMVPLMIIIYFFAVSAILIIHIDQVPHYLYMIVSNAFTGENFRGSPAMGGILGGLIVTGVRRASFSNEAGVGTAPMALGASKSSEPIREGLVSMLSPAIDTLLVCTLTALAILVTGVWQTSEANGVTLTSQAFESSLPGFGNYLLLVCAFFFAVTSLFSYNYYGSKALSFLLGVKAGNWYNYGYLLTIIWGAVATLSDVMFLIDIAFALMAIPTMLSGFVLAPKVMAEAKAYFARLAVEKEQEKKK